MLLLSKVSLDTDCIWDSGSLLWTDPTRRALQVFLPQQFLAVENPGASATLREEGIEEGIWITVDPVPGCIVCNVGESPWILLG
jgi:isopenicillin N synthase-like dioxygenase